MSMPNRCFESITPMVIGPWRVRVWRTEVEENVINNTDLIEWAESLVSVIVKEDTEITRAYILKHASDFERVSAVEVTDYYSGMGCLVYPNWH